MDYCSIVWGDFWQSERGYDRLEELYVTFYHMESNSVSRQSDRIREGQTAPALKESVIKDSVDGQKKSLIMDVMEARLSRLQNYKLALDTKLFKEKEYTSRVKETQEFLKKVANTTDPKVIEAATFHLSLDDGQLIRDQLLPQWSKGVIDMQKVALGLMRADNGTEQVEKIAATSLWDLFSQWATKLSTDSKAKSEIVRRANKHFGDIMSQGALDNATPEQQNAARAWLEAMYQMRYIAKEYIGESGGIAVPVGLQVVWENYRDSMDIKDDWFKLSETGKTQLASFLLYDLVPMIVSGWVAGAVGKWAITIASRMPAVVNYVNSGTKIAKGVSVGARAGLAATEAVAFDATFEGIRNQRLFTDKPHWQQDLIKNSFGFGFSRYLAGATKFARIPLDPLSNQLIKQWLIVPAIITGIGVWQKLMANDPDAYDGAWEEFLLGAIMTGAFHMTGKVLESKYPAKETGIQKLEMSPDGKKVDITTRDGQKFTTRMTDKLKSLWPKTNATKLNPKKASPDITDVEANVPKATSSIKNAVDAPGQKSVDTPTVNTATVKAPVLQLEWNGKKTTLADARIRLESIPKWTGETGIKIRDTEYTINRHTDNKIDVTSPGKEVKTYSSIDEFLWTLKSEVIATKPTGAPEAPATASKDTPLQLEWNGKLAEAPAKWPYQNESKLAEHQKEKWNNEQQLALKKAELWAIKESNMSPIASTEFGQAFVNSLTLNYRVELLPNGNHIVKVKWPNTKEWSIATEEHGIPKWDGYARQNYEERIVKEVNLLKQNPNYKAIELTKDIDALESKIKKVSDVSVQEKSRLISENPASSENNALKGNVNPVVAKNTQDTLSHSNTIDQNAQARIDAEHGIGRKWLTQADLLGGSFRSEMDAMMKMDDAAFRQNHDAVLARIGEKGNRSYEAEMYESAAKVRKMSEQELVDSIIIPTKSRSKLVEANRQQLSAQHVNRGPSKLSLDDKALIIAENAAIRARLTNIVWDKIPGGIAGLAGDAAKWNNWAIAEKLKGFDKRWLLLLLLLLPFLLKDCKWLSGADAEKWSVSPTAAADAICKECANWPESTIDKTRKNEYGKTLTEAYRNDISKRWMGTKVWKDTIKSFNANRSAISQNSLQSNNVAIALDLVIKSPTVSNIAKLQHCIGMFDKKSVWILKDTLDHKWAQDGILGPITTASINRIITSCISPTTAPKVAPAPVVPVQPATLDSSNQSVKRDAMDNNTGIVTNED